MLIAIVPGLPVLTLHIGTPFAWQPKALPERDKQLVLLDYDGYLCAGYLLAVLHAARHSGGNLKPVSRFHRLGALPVCRHPRLALQKISHFRTRMGVLPIERAGGTSMNTNTET
jgi:hypothetical protein